MSTVLERIVAHKRTEVAARKGAAPEFRLDRLPSPRDFAGARRGVRTRLIAEVKKASPSRGVLREDFDPVALAETYAANGAAALSVLTDETFFQGHDRFIGMVREVTPLPVLRKEFLIDPWQVAESRALGADAVLLIVALLARPMLREFLDRAADLGMAALVEVHSGEELETALDAGATVVGINNRDLHTFETRLETTEHLGPIVKAAGRLLISESGIFTAAHVERVAAAGADAVLVGEALVCAADVGAKVRELSGTVPWA